MFGLHVDLTRFEARQVEAREVVRDAVRLVADEVGEDDPSRGDLRVLLRHLQVGEAADEERGQPIRRHADATRGLDLERGSLGRSERPLGVNGHRGCLLGASLLAARGG